MLDWQVCGGDGWRVDGREGSGEVVIQAIMGGVAGDGVMHGGLVVGKRLLVSGVSGQALTDVSASGSILGHMVVFGSGSSSQASRKHRMRKASTSSWGG